MGGWGLSDGTGTVSHCMGGLATGPQASPTLVAPRRSRGAPRSSWSRSAAVEGLAAGRVGQLDQIARGVLAKRGTQLPEASRAPVADGRAEVANHVLDEWTHRAAGGHADLEPLGPEGFQLALVDVLDVEP